MSGLSCLFAEMRFAEAVDANGGEDHCAEHHLHEERIDGEQHECLRDDGDDDDAEQGRPDADMPASQYRTADNGCGSSSRSASPNGCVATPALLRGAGLRRFVRAAPGTPAHPRAPRP